MSSLYQPPQIKDIVSFVLSGGVLGKSANMAVTNLIDNIPQEVLYSSSTKLNGESLLVFMPNNVLDPDYGMLLMKLPNATSKPNPFVGPSPKIPLTVDGVGFVAYWDDSTGLYSKSQKISENFDRSVTLTSRYKGQSTLYQAGSSNLEGDHTIVSTATTPPSKAMTRSGLFGFAGNSNSVYKSEKIIHPLNAVQFGFTEMEYMAGPRVYSSSQKGSYSFSSTATADQLEAGDPYTVVDQGMVLATMKDITSFYYGKIDIELLTEIQLGSGQFVLNSTLAYEVYLNTQWGYVDELGVLQILDYGKWVSSSAIAPVVLNGVADPTARLDITDSFSGSFDPQVQFPDKPVFFIGAAVSLHGNGNLNYIPPDTMIVSGNLNFYSFENNQSQNAVWHLIENYSGPFLMERTVSYRVAPSATNAPILTNQLEAPVASYVRDAVVFINHSILGRSAGIVGSDRETEKFLEALSRATAVSSMMHTRARDMLGLANAPVVSHEEQEDILEQMGPVGSSRHVRNAILGKIGKAALGVGVKYAEHRLGVGSAGRFGSSDFESAGRFGSSGLEASGRFGSSGRSGPFTKYSSTSEERPTSPGSRRAKRRKFLEEEDITIDPFGRVCEFDYLFKNTQRVQNSVNSKCDHRLMAFERPPGYEKIIVDGVYDHWMNALFCWKTYTSPNLGNILCNDHKKRHMMTMIRDLEVSPEAKALLQKAGRQVARVVEEIVMGRRCVVKVYNTSETHFIIRLLSAMGESSMQIILGDEYVFSNIRQEAYDGPKFSSASRKGGPRDLEDDQKNREFFHKVVHVRVVTPQVHTRTKVSSSSRRTKVKLQNGMHHEVSGLDMDEFRTLLSKNRRVMMGDHCGAKGLDLTVLDESDADEEKEDEEQSDQEDYEESIDEPEDFEIPDGEDEISEQFTQLKIRPTGDKNLVDVVLKGANDENLGENNLLGLGFPSPSFMYPNNKIIAGLCTADKPFMMNRSLPNSAMFPLVEEGEENATTFASLWITNFPIDIAGEEIDAYHPPYKHIGFSLRISKAFLNDDDQVQNVITLVRIFERRGIQGDLYISVDPKLIFRHGAISGGSWGLAAYAALSGYPCGPVLTGTLSDYYKAGSVQTLDDIAPVGRLAQKIGSFLMQKEIPAMLFCAADSTMDILNSSPQMEKSFNRSQECSEMGTLQKFNTNEGLFVHQVFRLSDVDRFFTCGGTNMIHNHKGVPKLAEHNFRIQERAIPALTIIQNPSILERDFKAGIRALAKPEKAGAALERGAQEIGGMKEGDAKRRAELGYDLTAQIMGLPTKYRKVKSINPAGQAQKEANDRSHGEKSSKKNSLANKVDQAKENQLRYAEAKDNIAKAKAKLSESGSQILYTLKDGTLKNTPPLQTVAKEEDLNDLKNATKKYAGEILEFGFPWDDKVGEFRRNYLFVPKIVGKAGKSKKGPSSKFSGLQRAIETSREAPDDDNDLS